MIRLVLFVLFAAKVSALDRSSNLPILAKITPIDLSSGRQKQTFTAYVFLQQGTSANNYPYYSVCRQSNSSYDKVLISIDEKLSKILKAVSSQDKIQGKAEKKGETGKDETVKHNGNSNIQSDIFQCEGITCPDSANSCKVTETAIEPDYELIKKTISCLSKDNQVVKKEENEFKNPNKGSSLNAMRTYDRNQNKKGFEEEMDKFKKEMVDAFGVF